MASVQTFSITTDGARPLAEVAKELESLGLRRVQVLHAIAIITGEAEAHRAPQFRAVPGVADVSAEPAAGVGPPGGSDTW